MKFHTENCCYDHLFMGGNSDYVQLLLGEQSHDVQLQSLISPACNLNQHSPAFVIMHGVQETMFGEQAKLFLQKLKEKKIPGIILTHPGEHLIEGNGILPEGIANTFRLRVIRLCPAIV